MSELPQLPQTCAVVMPQIWPPVQSADVSRQLPATHWPLGRQTCIAPYCMSATHWPLLEQPSHTWVVVLQTWLLPAQSADVLQLPLMQAPPEQTWFEP